jgi:hypothetical protein
LNPQCPTEALPRTEHPSVASVAFVAGAPPATVEPTVSAEPDILFDHVPWPDPLAESAYRGLAGDFVRMVEPHSEADPAAVLIQALTAFGSVAGRRAHFRAESDKHYTNSFVCIVGASSKARKGTSWGHVVRQFGLVDPSWASTRVQHGLASGEGLIHAVRDPVMKRRQGGRGKSRGQGSTEIDEGVSDKRFLVVETEFAQLLKVMGREGNTVSPVIRNAWDTGALRSLVKTSPSSATGAHISIIGHITKAELKKLMNQTEAGNGFGNRFLWFCARRSKLLPEGGALVDAHFEKLAPGFAAAVDFARNTDELTRDNQARDLWHAVYGVLSEGKPGLLGSILGRAEAQVMRVAVLYALLDQSKVIRLDHLRAALEIWRYAEDSACFLFGDSLGDPVADEILRALRKSGSGMTRSEIRDVFNKHKTAAQIDQSLVSLFEAGTVNRRFEPTAGRPREIWFAQGAPATKATKATKGGGDELEDDLSSLRSLMSRPPPEAFPVVVRSSESPEVGR